MKITKEEVKITERHKETIKVEVVAGVVIKQDGKYLLVQEKQPRAYGLWNWPAGKVDVGESIEQAAIRETKEESGYDVRLIKEITIFHAEAADTIKHAFEGKIIGGQLNFPQDEILDAQWFTLDEIKQMADKLRGGWILESINILENL
jgi:ADP-ribose pyrophosphatase YjhB (NUDIX family)